MNMTHGKIAEASAVENKVTEFENFKVELSSNYPCIESPEDVEIYNSSVGIILGLTLVCDVSNEEINKVRSKLGKYSQVDKATDQPVVSVRLGILEEECVYYLQNLIVEIRESIEFSKDSQFSDSEAIIYNGNFLTRQILEKISDSVKTEPYPRKAERIISELRKILDSEK